MNKQYTYIQKFNVEDFCLVTQVNMLHTNDKCQVKIIIINMLILNCNRFRRVNPYKNTFKIDCNRLGRCNELDDIQNQKIGGTLVSKFKIFRTKQLVNL